MQSLPVDRKIYLLAQSRQMRTSTNNHSSTSLASPSKFASYSPASAVSLLPRLVPQLTGGSGTDSMMKRFSLASITGWGTNPATEPDHDSNAPELTDVVPEPITPQVTGGIFGSWWNRPTSESTNSLRSQMSPLRPDITGGSGLGPDLAKDPSWYVSEIERL